MPMLIRCSALVADIKVASSVVMLQLHSRVRAIVGLVIQMLLTEGNPSQISHVAVCGIKLW